MRSLLELFNRSISRFIQYFPKISVSLPTSRIEKYQLRNFGSEVDFRVAYKNTITWLCVPRLNSQFFKKMNKIKIIFINTRNYNVPFIDTFRTINFFSQFRSRRRWVPIWMLNSSKYPNKYQILLQFDRKCHHQYRLERSFNIENL